MKPPRSLLVAAVLVAGAPIAGPPAGRAQEVTLPLERYEQLRARSRPSAPPASVPASPFALEAANLEITVGRDSVRVSQRLTLSIFTDEWVRVPIAAPGGLTTSQLGTLDGRVETDDGVVVLVARGRGRHSLRLESVTALDEDATATRKTLSAAVALPAAAVVTGTVVTGPDIEEVEFADGGLAAGSPAPHRFDFVGTPGSVLRPVLRGKGRAVERTRLPLRFDVRALTRAELARTRTRLVTSLAFDVASGEVDSMEVTLPAGFDVVSVTGVDVGWTQDAARLSITPAVPVTGRLDLDVALVGEPLPAAFAAPLVVPARAARVTLLSQVIVVADGIPEMTDLGSGRRAEAKDLEPLPEPARRTQGAVFVVRDAKRPPRWSVEWSEASAVLPAQVDRLLVNALVGSAGQAAYQLWAEVRSTGSTEILLSPPPGLELLSVERDGVPVLPGRSDQGLVIPLAAGAETQILHLAGLLSGLSIPPEGEISFPLPSSSAPIGQVEVAVRLPGDRTYALVDAERAGGVSAPPAPRVRRAAGQSHGAGAKTAGLDLAALVDAASAAERAPSSWFQAPANAALVEARWSALSGSLGPLAIRVKPAREKEEWF